MSRQQLVSTLALVAFANPPPGDPPWNEILGPSRAVWPEPQIEVVWRADFGAALREARASNRPLFVTLRCLPCSQCQSFDQAVLEGGPELDPLLAQFVTVRLTSVRELDLRVFPVEGWQDLDLSWWGWFLSPRAEIYGVFGGKDEQSDTSRISPRALANALRRVLEHHYDPRRDSWSIDGPAPEPGGEASTPTQLAGFASWSKRGGLMLEKDGCMHCHQVAEILRQPALDAKTLDPARDLDVWPLPENVGLVLDRDDGLLVTEVAPDGPAERVSMRAGDRLAAAGERKLFGQADFRAVLQRGPRGGGAIDLRWWRGDELMSASLELGDGWRKTVLGWRMSISQGNIGAVPGFAWPLACPPDLRRERGIAAGSMAVQPYFGERDDWPARRAGLREDDVIVAVGGESPDVAQRYFLTWFRLRYEPGDEIVLTVRGASGRDREVRYRAPAPGSD